MIRRREFITLVGGAAQPSRIRIDAQLARGATHSVRVGDQLEDSEVVGLRSQASCLASPMR
jgi:hypothetical protein